MKLSNLLLMLLIFIIAYILLRYFIKKRQNEVEEEQFSKDDQTYSLERMTEFVKKRIDEVKTFINT